MIEEILSKNGDDAVEAIKANLASSGTNATMKTSNSVSRTVTQVGSKTVLTVVGARPFFPTVETGSRPSTKNPSPDMIQSLTEWAQVRNVPKEAVWGVAKTILKDGSKLWQNGGRTDIYTIVREPLVEAVKADIKRAMMAELKKGLTPSESVFKSA